ncbi:MAG: nitrate/nitrite transporter NrtS [Myxococcota bacterium]
MSDWLRLARDGAVVRRALRTALLVGSILTAINHGEAILRGDVDGVRLFRICLTVLVPYAVSTTSSVAALRSVAGNPPAGG